MDLVINMMIALGALVAAAYCMLLSRRLRALTRLDGDIGKAIAVLSQQVDALTRALKTAESTNAQSNNVLEQQIGRADAAARRLELLMAAHRSTEKVAFDDERLATASPKAPLDGAATHEEFAPFARHTQRPQNEPRPRVLRQRDPVGAQ